MSRHRHALVLLLAVSSPVVFGKCLPRSNAEDGCRYPAGDSWCSEHHKRKPYAYSDGCLQASQKTPAQQDTDAFTSANLPKASGLDDGKIVAEATRGQFKAIKGSYVDKDCNETQDYTAEVADLNGDGQPEVFVTINGTCLGGMAGSNINLYIKGKNGQWMPQFGFPGIYTVLPTKHKGYPDIEIGGPGFCFPVWRWNGQNYDLHKRCP